MPFYSAIFKGCSKTTPATTMSLRFTTSLKLHRTPKTLINPSILLFLVKRRSHTTLSFSSRPANLDRGVFTCSGASSRTLGLDWRSVGLPYLQQQQQQSSNYGRYAYQDESSDDSDFEYGSSQHQKSGSTLDNIDEWRWKFTMLLRNKEDQEVVSREKKDRRDFEQLSALATRMGLHCRQYSKVVVFSKVPLPNYRSDLDDKRPQREVTLPFGLLREVDAHLKAYHSQNPKDGGNFSHNSSRSSIGGSILTDEGFIEQEPLSKNSVVVEKILRQKSLLLRNQQQGWQESPEGQKMLEFRRSLPAYKEKDALLKAVSENQVVVISGETGCGKTTQLPQYILETEIEAARGATCSIICTQPRRISAMSVSERVAAERGEKLGESVGYKVRLEGIKGRDTHLLFCTTGILLRRLLVDRNLKGITHVIVDEIHERGMNEDFLLIVLKDLLPCRPELRLILMSATLNAELFSSYFGGAPMIHIPGFTYPVRAHFLENILESTGYRLTPHNQIDDYGQEKAWKMQKQSQTLKKRKSQIASAVEDALEAADYREYGLRTRESLSCWNPDSIGFNFIEHVLCHIVKKERPGAVLLFMTGWDDINSLKDQLQAHPLLGDPTRVLLLACHGSMASSEQRLIFEKPEDGVRKIVLATNMAETSITINDVVFVVDCGKAKETSYDALNNTPCLLPSWISKAAARQRRGRAGRVQPGECFHLYPRCVYDAFSDYQLPELLRTPLQSLCLQIKTLQLGSISEFLSRALQPPEPLSVQNAVEYLKIIGALDENENLTVLGRNLSVLPVEPKLGKMLILGAIFNCLDPVMTVVAGLSARDPFLMPFDKKDLAESAKAQFSANDYSDHLALVRAYDGWKDAEKQQSGYEYCWKNFLSAQTLKAIDSLRKQFFYLLKDTGLIDYKMENCNTWSHDEHLIRAIICAGLFPGLCSVVNKEKSITLKTTEDGQVLLYSNSVNAGVSKIPYPWLVFNEKVKVNSVFLRDSTGVSDSVLLLFGGKISSGGLDGHLKMLGGYLEFFMKPSLAETYLSLRRDLEELIQKKLVDPKFDIQPQNELLLAVRLLVSEDQCEGRFVYGRQLPAPPPKIARKEKVTGTLAGDGGDNSKTQLQTVLLRAGHEAPTYKTKQLKNNLFCSTVTFNELSFTGNPCSGKKHAEKDAAAEALLWLKGETYSSSQDINHVSVLLKKSKSTNKGKPSAHRTSGVKQTIKD
ncbi:dsrm domain-containing protein/DEAD domain-containing protein/Helicase_C domain-containing protein/HA2 domain-containing protein/OB_NTP_bind domain-containing protein [Cephalotus follicularis]|uniref:RNA helicase n=1 Tax=Cephalotus follicularis TaxID=3775 RepID=A0A1Q3BHK8_CEPFO|nr:dsrm domain-containing protein/DEAD domain-containing protein/Helicase_C domain-containing protein/HA2 domain-containing protein/OB_NTP_bind domain-containing protein [Cephalotus follicularis]